VFKTFKTHGLKDLQGLLKVISFKIMVLKPLKWGIHTAHVLSHTREFPDTNTFIFPDSRCFLSIHRGQYEPQFYED